MATTVIETYGMIRADGTLELEEKLTPAPGRFKVRVELESESAEDFAKRFAALVATWRDGTRFRSRMDQMASHPALREIIAMGEKAVPLILAHLERNGGFLFLALHEITGVEPPIADGFRGNKVMCDGWVGYDIEGIQAAWLAWGREQGYRWEHVV
jgi:hypothetical protein